MRDARLRQSSALLFVIAVGACSVLNKYDDLAPAATGGDTSSGGGSGKGGSAGASTGGTSGAATGGDGGAPEGGTSGTSGAAGDTATGGTAGTAGTCTTTFYRDADDDTYGDDDTTRVACSAPSGYVDRGGDCADDDAARNPGATEICNGLDENCDDPDEGSTCPAGCVPLVINMRLHLLCAGPVPWGMARTTCEDEGMVLARIRNSADSVAIRTQMSTVHMATEYWLGGSDGPAPADEGTWRWLAGNDIFYPATALYNNWAMDEPVAMYPAQDCLKAAMGPWHAEQCQLTFAFVCEELP